MAFVNGRESFDIFKDEHFRLLEGEKVDNVVNNISSSLAVFKTFAFSCHREWLTGKTGDVKVH